MQFQLDLLIDSKALPVIRQAGMNIIVAKSSGDDTKPNVSWIVTDAFQDNRITWEETYGIYAAPHQTLEHGATISRLSDVFTAQDGAAYSFGELAVFSDPILDGGVAAGSFQVNNDMPDPDYSVLTFGLEQSAVVRGKIISPAPLNAALVPASMEAVFTPYTTVWVWLQANVTSGMIITQITSKATSVTFGGDVTKQSLSFQADTGRFLP
jgi:hypothetical protein